MKKMSWSWWILGIGIFIIICGHSGKSTNTSYPSSASQTFEEKYPNISAFVEDFNAATPVQGERVISDRLKRLMDSDPNWKGQYVSDHGFGGTYIGPNGELAPAINCAAKFATEHSIDYSSCETGERILISHNYLNSSEKQVDGSSSRSRDGEVTELHNLLGDFDNRNMLITSTFFIKNTEPRKDWRYMLNGMEILQKIDDGYLMQLNYINQNVFLRNSVMFLYPDPKIPWQFNYGNGLDTLCAEYAGEYKYKNLSGFDEQVHAFKLVGMKGVLNGKPYDNCSIGGSSNNTETQASVDQTRQVQYRQEVDSAESFTVNVPNSQGGYTAIVIKKSGDGYTGPNGEHYSEFPKVSELKAVYLK